jgi:hypothetical protein
MTDQPDAPPPRRALSAAARGRLAAALFIAVGAALGSAGTALLLHDDAPAQRASSAASQVLPPADVAPPANVTPPSVQPAGAAGGPSAPPVEISIPSIQVSSPLIGLGLNSDGSLQVPTDYARAGWFNDGPAPGDTGPPAVIAGHVDSKTGPAVFYRLRELRPGAPVLIRRADGTTARFVVDQLADYSKTSFPTAQVYGPTSRPELRLITCSGGFDAGSGHYLNNLVVYAHEQPDGDAVGG